MDGARKNAVAAQVWGSRPAHKVMWLKADTYSPAYGFLEGRIHSNDFCDSCSIYFNSFHRDGKCSLK